MNVFELELEVKGKHLDDLEHVNNVVYLQWVQDVAAEHWFSKAGKDSGVFWVARKHEIEYLRPAYKGDSLILRTWVEKMEGLISLRKVEIMREGELICICNSHWVMLDAQTMKPKRIKPELANLFL